MRHSQFIVLATLVAACGGGDSGTNAPPLVPVATVDVSLSVSNISVGGTSKATALPRDASGGPLVGRTVSWNSSNPSVASIASTGEISALSAGSVTISGSTGGITGSATLTVGPPPVASVSVTLASGTLVPGATTMATAATRDASGAVVTGRQVTWTSTNSAVATVSGSGQVTAFAAGTTSISATSEGRVGSAQLVVTEPPVATVQIFGTERVKVGDAYQLTAEARLADGTLVQRPIVWAIPVPGSLSISASGVLTALQTGTLNFTVTIGGVTASASVTAYDWQLLSGSGVVGLYLASNNEITNKYGQSEYPQLVIGCASGTFIVSIFTDRFVTANGFVSYSFNGGTIFNGNWLESSDFSNLTYPGSTNLSRKSFANQIATGATFGLAFTEFQAAAKAMIFRVTGLAALLPTVMNACPSNSLRAEDDEAPTLDEVLARFTAPAEPSASRTARANAPENQGAGIAGVRAPLEMLHEPSALGRQLLSQP